MSRVGERLPSSRLRSRLDLGGPALHACYRQLRDHPHLARVYPAYLVLLHAMMRASVPLMEAALARARTLAPADRVARTVAAYLEHHLPEEHDHDRWLLEDLALIGVSEEQVLRVMPSPSVAAMAGAQYYWIHHHHPACILGYIAVLEGNPPPAGEIRAIARRSGLPEAAFRTWIKHAELDPGHARELDSLLDDLQPDEETFTAIAVSAMTTIRFATASFSELLEDAGPGEPHQGRR